MMNSLEDIDSYVHWFDDISQSEMPTVFTFPFHYTPHPLCVRAAEVLMQDLTINDRNHNFGLDDTKAGISIGKMFGVLLVKNNEGRVGYLKAFSGKLANSNIHTGFVPPLFDMLDENGFYVQGENELKEMNARILFLEESEALQMAKSNFEKVQEDAQISISNFKIEMRINKEERQRRRLKAQQSSNKNEYALLEEDLIKWSYHDQHLLKVLKNDWKEKIIQSSKQLEVIEQEIMQLKTSRKNKSNALQQRLFEQYDFLNQRGKVLNVQDIFKNTVFENPPSGAGECATPKLLQFAFKHELQPLAMAEFWWGASPVSEVRKHKQYYPACRGKCEPILKHMLDGIELEPNPMRVQRSLSHQLKVIYEDEQILVLNKPAELLSVPGKHEEESVQSIIQSRYPQASGPLLVHRLDMSTSGIILVAKNKIAHQYLQAQFIKKTAQKKYTALLDGILHDAEGWIDLPLRVDLDNRPHQVVCFEHGKKAITRWERISIEGNKTRVLFYPITGRTHQLRVHAAHQLGLNMPIVGDDLYGAISERLYLHATSLTIKHPGTKDVICFECPPPF